MSAPWIDAQDDGEDVVIRVGANDATLIAHALRHLAEAIEAAAEQAFDNGAIPAPGLKIVVVK